jgi:hypothetical protein
MPRAQAPGCSDAPCRGVGITATHRWRPLVGWGCCHVAGALVCSRAASLAVSRCRSNRDRGRMWISAHVCPPQTSSPGPLALPRPWRASACAQFGRRYPRSFSLPAEPAMRVAARLEKVAEPGGMHIGLRSRAPGRISDADRRALAGRWILPYSTVSDCRRERPP